MLSVELLILNLEEIRRRSLILWNSLPEENYDWQPDENAMTCLEMIRHILEGEHLFHIIVKNRGNLNDYISPWQDKEYTSLQDEIDFALP
jgi:DinB superfamily